MPVFVRQIQVGRHVRSGVRDVVVGSRASPFASAEQACRMYSRGLRQLACWTKSEYQRIAFMLSTCRTAPKGESRPRSRARKSVRIPGGCRLAPVLRLPSVQAPFQVSRGGKSGGFASSVASIRHRTWRLARPERVCTCPSHSSTGAPDTSTSSTVPGIVQSARRPAGRAGALRADVVVVPVAAALSRYDIKAARSWGGRPFAGSELTIRDLVLGHQMASRRSHCLSASCAVRGQVDAEQLEMLARFQLLADRDAGIAEQRGFRLGRKNSDATSASIWIPSADPLIHCVSSA
eukprot:tig00021687_g23118.t2